jgi:tetratricopeptide (TPR) repeat protein
VAEAHVLAANNQLEKANEMLAEMVRRDPDNLAAWQELGEVQLSQTLNDDAMASFEAVLKSKPAAAQAQQGEVRAAVGAALVDRAAGNQDRALSDLLRGRKFVPHSAELLMDFGLQADSMQIYRDADEALSEAHGLVPDDAKILYALAHVEVDEQKTAEAEGHLRAYLKMMPEDASAHYGLGHLLHMTAKDDEAKSELERSIAIRPQQTESYYELGEISLDLHEDAAAKDAYAKVLAAAPNHGGALTGMGVIAYRAKDYSGAEGYLKKAVAYAPDYVTAHHYYAMTLARLGQLESSQRESTLADELTAKQNKMRHGYTLIEKP